MIENSHHADKLWLKIVTTMMMMMTKLSFGLAMVTAMLCLLFFLLCQVQAGKLKYKTKIFSCKSQGQHMKNIISQYSKLQVTRSTYMKNIISQYSIYCDISFFLLCKVQARKSIKHDFTTVVTMMMAGWWRWWWKWRWWPQARRGWSTQYRNINLFSTPPTWPWMIGSRLMESRKSKLILMGKNSVSNGRVCTTFSSM